MRKWNGFFFQARNGYKRKFTLPGTCDLSGLVVGDRYKFNRFLNEPLFMDHFRRAFVYADHYEKMLFGTDWPLAPIDVYIDFVRRLIPERHHEDVFYRNATQLFPRIGPKLGGLQI